MGDDNWKINTKENKYIGNNLDTADGTWKENFYFVIGADPQFGFIHMKESMDSHNYKEKISWDEEIRLAKIAVQKVNQLKPKPRFFIICGDLTNEYPHQSKDIKKNQIADFKKVFSEVDPDIPLLYFSGNHDIGDVPSAESISSYRSEFGDDYFSFRCGGVSFIVYNSQYYKEPNVVKELAAEHDKWFNEQLEKAKNTRIVCISHIPWFQKKLDEEDSIYNIELFKRMEMVKKLYDAGVGYMFFGHRHQNEFGYYKDMELVTTTSMTCDLGGGVPGLRIAMVRQKDIIHRFYPYDEFPSSVDLQSGQL